jgi:hypothetical protein
LQAHEKLFKERTSTFTAGQTNSANVTPMASTALVLGVKSDVPMLTPLSGEQRDFTSSLMIDFRIAATERHREEKFRRRLFDTKLSPGWQVHGTGGAAKRSQGMHHDPDCASAVSKICVNSPSFQLSAASRMPPRVARPSVVRAFANFNVRGNRKDRPICPPQ